MEGLLSAETAVCAPLSSSVWGHKSVFLVLQDHQGLSGRRGWGGMHLPSSKVGCSYHQRHTSYPKVKSHIFAVLPSARLHALWIKRASSLGEGSACFPQTPGCELRSRREIQALPKALIQSYFQTIIELFQCSRYHGNLEQWEND